MQELWGTLVRYPWGTYDAIPEILGIPADGQPAAEFWLGDHPLAPARLGDTTLADAIAADPSLVGADSTERFGPRLPFLLKILSARHALSIQVHPTREQAEEGWASEEASGIAFSSPERVYKDDWPKPEILVALDEFHTLVGFRPPAESVRLFTALDAGPALADLIGPLSHRDGVAAMQEVFLDVLALEGDRLKVVDEVLAAAMSLRDDDSEVGEFARTALELEETFPGNPGILAALLMNRYVLQPGEAVYVPAGVLHAHLRGTGVEVMASSDNVVRGGLTNKHIAVDELMRIADFSWQAPEIIAGTESAPGVWDYPTHCEEFDVTRLEVTADGLDLPVPHLARVALVTRGAARFDDGHRTIDVSSGGAVFVPAGNPPVRVVGAAQVFVGAPGLL